MCQSLQKNPKNININNYQKIRKKYKYTLKIQKRKWEENNIKQLETLTNNPKQFWQHLKTLKGKLKPNSVDAIPPRQWIEHFSKLFNVEENTTVKNNFLKATNSKCVRENSTLDSPFTADEVSKGIAQLKNKKASGNDSISNEMIKTGSPTNLPFLVTLFNTIPETKRYPEDWTCGIITPIHKSGETDNPDNYRGITINSCLSKLLNLLLTNRLTSFVNEKGILKYNQIGFRKGFCTADHVLTIKTIIDKYLSKNQKLYLCFVDFRKAYDSTWREGLFDKLYSY